MTTIEKRRLRRFLKEVSEKLSGQWVLLGGSLLPLLDLKARPTYDIDLAGFGRLERGQVLELLEVAEAIGLSVESINQAAGYFLRKIPGWRRHVIEMVKGSRATIYRPDAELFIVLKLARLTESDFFDCLEMLRYVRRKKEKLDLKWMLPFFKKRSRSAHQELKQRILELERAIERACRVE